jgi:protein-tyrosine-phosphatase
MGKVKSVLFVCTGNSCRSVMAEGLLKKYLKETGKDNIEVSSAGIAGMDGFRATEETIDAMRSQGIDMTGFKSRRLTKEMITASDLILVMEDVHRDFVLKLDPTAGPKTHLLKRFDSEDKRKYPEGLNVPDPIGKPMDFYKLSLEIIKEEARRIAGLL